MFKLPDFSTVKRIGRLANDSISNWVEEAEARAQERAALLPQKIAEECAAIRLKHAEESIRHRKKLAEKTYTSEDIAYLKEQLKTSGWTDEQCDKEFSVYTIKDKSISTELQALNQATALNAQLMKENQHLQQQNQQLQQLCSNLQQQNQQLQQLCSNLQQQNQQLQDRYNQLENEYHYLDCQNSPSKDLYYPLQQKNEQLQQQNQQLQQQLQEALAELAKHK